MSEYEDIKFYKPTYIKHRADTKEYYKEYYLKNKEKIKQYQLENKNKIKNKQKEYRENNKEYFKQYYQKHKEEFKKNRNLYYQKNRDKILKQVKEYNQGENRKEYLEYLKKYHKEYYKNHRKEILKYLKEKRKNNLHFNLKSKMITRMWFALRSKNKDYNWNKRSFNIGYSIEELKNHLQKTMPNGYTWQDYLNGKLHIDHIIPINAFNFTSPDHEDFKRCWALKNLQLIPAEENLIKGKKIDKPFQPSLTI